MNNNEENKITPAADVGGLTGKLREALRWALEWIDAVPPDTTLPAMPGFDRDYVNDLLDAREVLATKAEAAQAAPEQAVPEGYALVPVKETPAMVDAYNNVPSGIAGSPPHAAHVWAAMLAATPVPPVSAPAEQPATSVPRLASIDTPAFAELIENHDRASDGKEMDAAYAAIVAHVDAHIACQAQALPVAWVRCHPDGSLTTEYLSDQVIEPVRKASGAWLPLTLAAPTLASAPQAAPFQKLDLTDYSKPVVYSNGTSAPQAERAAGPEVLLDDARRYQRLRILGAAPFGTKQLEDGHVLRFQSLDAFLDADIATHPSRGEAAPSSTEAIAQAASATSSENVDSPELRALLKAYRDSGLIRLRARHDAIIAHIQSLIAAQVAGARKDAWVSVEDRLPANDQYVWASWTGAGNWNHDAKQGLARYVDGLGWQPQQSTGWDWVVTHWMALPQSPASDSQEVGA